MTVNYNSYWWLKLSSCAASTDFPDTLSPLLSIVHRSQHVFHATSCISTELLLISSSCSPNPCMSVWRGPEENISYEFVFTSPALSRVPCSSNLDDFEMGGRWSYSCRFVWGFLEFLFITVRSILVQLQKK